MPGYTTRYGFPYPLSGDPIYLGATQQKNMANSIDAALYAAGVPAVAQTNPPRAQLKRTSNLSIPNNSDTIVTFDGKNYDSEAVRVPASPMYSSTTTLTIRVAGVYQVEANVVMVGAGGARNARVLYNGTSTSNTLMVRAEPGASDNMAMSGTFQFSVGDVLRVMVWQNSGSAQNITLGASSYYTRLSATYQGAFSA